MGLIKTVHRWVSTFGMLFIAYVAITGSLVAFYEIIDPNTFGAGGGQGAKPRTAEERATDAAIPGGADATKLVAGLDGALAELSDAELNGVKIRLYERDGRALADVTVGTGYQADQITIDAVSGQKVRGAAEAQAAVRLNTLFQRFHSGAVAGLAGKILVLLTGLALLALCLTGGWIYLDMWRRRAGQGRKQAFWG